MTMGLLFSSLTSSALSFSASSSLSTLLVYSLITCKYTCHSNIYHGIKKLAWRNFNTVSIRRKIITNLDEVRHGEVHDVVFPGELQDDVRVQEVVTLEQARREAVVSLVVKEVSQQVLRMEKINIIPIRSHNKFMILPLRPQHFWTQLHIPLRL